jgi:PAS domain S-box-containing protein
MAIDPEKRDHQRFEYKLPVELSYQDPKTYHRAEMVNYCEGGMCIESEIPFQPGKNVYIRAVHYPAEIPFFKPEADVNAAVRFCRKKNATNSHFHRIGVQFLQSVPTEPSRKSHAITQDLRRRAEIFLDNRFQTIRDVPPEEVHQLVHELHVHQIELEMQNDELRRAQIEIESSRNRYSFLYDFAPIGYFTLDPYGQIIEVNLTAAKYLGVERAFLVNKALSLYISRPDRDTFRLHRREVFRSRAPQACEIQLKKKDGTRFYARLDSTAVQDADGNFNRLLTAVSDIDAHRRVAQEKQKLEHQLQQAQKMKAIGTLAGGIAHNFNNLLMGIEGRISLMLFDLDADNPHYDNLLAIEKTIMSATKLTREMLGFARGGKYETRPTDLNRLIKDTSATFSPTRKDIEIRMQLQEEIWSVEVDCGQLEQVLLNLYINAMQAMPAGGTLSVQTENIAVDHPADGSRDLSAGRYVRISVTDTGVGMDATTRQRIFEPFFTTKEMERGAGLGLAFVYGVIRNHNGSITVHSRKNEGTTFHISLPASMRAAAVEKKESNAIFPGTETVLLVDDEDIILDVGRQMLCRLGYEVFTAQSGREALDFCRQYRERIELVILDLIMPGMGGGETFDRLREINSQIKVLLSSGYNINGEATAILERQCSGFIQKPFKLKDLSKKLRKILDN